MQVSKGHNLQALAARSMFHFRKRKEGGTQQNTQVSKEHHLETLSSADQVQHIP